MYQNKYNGRQYYPEINIELDNGIYVFSIESATGKTRLYKALKSVEQHGDVVAYTYSDTITKLDLKTLVNENTRVIILDRYDMYFNKFADVIEEYKDKAIVLIDCKVNDKIAFDHTYAEVVMEKNKLTVRPW